MSIQDPFVSSSTEEGTVTFQVIAREVLGRPAFPVLVIVSSSTRGIEPEAILNDLAPVLWQMLAAKHRRPGALTPSRLVETGPPSAAPGTHGLEPFLIAGRPLVPPVSGGTPDDPESFPGTSSFPPPAESPDETRGSRLRTVLGVMTERASRMREGRGEGPRDSRENEAPAPDPHERQILRMITLLEMVIQKEADRPAPAASGEVASGKAGSASVPIRLPFHDFPVKHTPGDPL